MKQISFFFLILAGITILLLSSCTTSQTFIVQGTPGTVIADHQNRQLAVVDQTGQAQVTIKRDGYMHYLQSKAPGSSVFVPFGLDYTDKNYSSRIAWGVGLVVTGSVFALEGGLLVAILSGEEGAGLICAGVGVGVGGLSFLTLPWLIDGDYDYNKIQKTNNDLIK